MDADEINCITEIKVKLGQLEERVEEREKRRIDQCREYDRRLLELNNKAAQYRDMKDDCVLKETYQVEHKTLADKTDHNTIMIAMATGGLLVLEIVFKFLF